MRDSRTLSIDVYVNGGKGTRIQLDNMACIEEVKRNDDREYISFCKSKLSLRKRCFVVVDENKVVHKSWLYRYSALALQLGYGFSRVIGDCETDINYRGRGYYPAALREICRRVRGSIVIFVESDNMASKRGIEKAGFEMMETVIIKRCRLFYEVLERMRVNKE